MRCSIQRELQSPKLLIRRPNHKPSSVPSPVKDVKDTGKCLPEEVAIKDKIPENDTVACYIPQTLDISRETCGVEGLNKLKGEISVKDESKEEDEVKDFEEKLAFAAFLRLYRETHGETRGQYRSGFAMARDALACAFWIMALLMSLDVFINGPHRSQVQFFGPPPT
ncbi:hypothetical protein AMTRI_Chr05g73500 [Amborella trichopoda]|uniref:Uncharacterized protein n=1 Tax=Amborella trichopoda TaxID=13333 RepID=W1PA81_AMBTC|nr:uncharacterized protein LOC18432062 [Amborella trichopoda]ERN03910.1 hypothetical protein AMTR_s00078p00186760 [Amborella trichopoda]|eukprot:XP_006842235.1 uncharacterized protein LOC18432062 [Amborella trichopoda]